ncbi:tissue factor-like isoform 1-T3 [Aulostomus maculatus]
MASLKSMLYIGVFVSAWTITTEDEVSIPKAENVRWISLDFKTTLSWTAPPSNHTFTVLYSRDDGDWLESENCIRISESHCDLTSELVPFDWTYSADIQTEPTNLDFDLDLEEFPHTYTSHFNPYKESELSAVEFRVEVSNDSKATVTITDSLTSIHQKGKQLTIRDIFKNDLKYKISYYKSGSTGKRDIISDSSTAEVLGLDAGQKYCFMVAAYIPSRPQNTQQGAWGIQQCAGESNTELNLAALLGGLSILLIVLLIIVTVTIIYCKCCRKGNKAQTQTSQTSTIV